MLSKRMTIKQQQKGYHGEKKKKGQENSLLLCGSERNNWQPLQITASRQISMHENLPNN